MTKHPSCPTHKRELVPAVFEASQVSFVQGNTPGFQCPEPGCRIKYAAAIAPDVGGFFTLDENGKPLPFVP